MVNTKKSILISTLLGIAALQITSPALAADNGNNGSSCGSSVQTGDTLYVYGTDNADEVTAYKSGNSLYVDHFSADGNVNETCGPFNSVSSISAKLNNGNDYFDGSALSISLTVYGGKGNDEILGGSGADTLNGDDGEDTLSGGQGDDMLDGGNDGDLIVGCDGEDKIVGGSGNDFLGGGSAIENPNGTQLYISANCSSSDDDDGDTIEGGTGNDFLSGGSGEDKLDGGDGHDALTGNDGQEDKISGGDDHDLIVEEGDGDGNRTDWFKAYGNGGDDFIIANRIRAELHGGKGNDALMTTSSSMDAKLYGGKNGDFIATEDTAPQGSCGSGNDKGHTFLDDCEGTGWADDGFEELLKKLDQKSEYDNPYYAMFNAFMNSEYLDGKNWMYYGQNEEPEIIYNFPSRHTFDKWNENRTRNLYDFFSVTSKIGEFVEIGGVHTMFTTLWCYAEGDYWQCGSILGPNFECYETAADNSKVLVYSATQSAYEGVDPVEVCEATTFASYVKNEYSVDIIEHFNF